MLLYVITRFRIQDYATWKVAFDDTVDVRIPLEQSAIRSSGHKTTRTPSS
jgi:hypothetical protein